MNDSKFQILKTEEEYQKHFAKYIGTAPSRYPCIGYLEYVSGGIVGDFYNFRWEPIPYYITDDIYIGIYVTGFADGYKRRSV